MQWIVKQLKISAISRSALALLCAFSLVGFAPDVKAQGNGSVKVGDATLEEFMAAFAHSFEGAHYIQVDVTPIFAASSLGTEVDVLRFPVVGLFPNGPMLVYATEPISPDGTALSSYLSTNGVSVATFLESLVSVMASDLASNMVERVANFLTSSLDSNAHDSPTVETFADYIANIWDDLNAFKSEWWQEQSERGLVYTSVPVISNVLSTVFDRSDGSNGDSGVYIPNGTFADDAISVYDHYTVNEVESLRHDFEDWLLGNETPEVIWGNMEELTAGIETNLNNFATNYLFGVDTDVNATLSPLTNAVNSARDENALAVSNFLDNVHDVVATPTNDLGTVAFEFTNSIQEVTDWLLGVDNSDSELTLLNSTSFHFGDQDFDLPPIRVNLGDSRFSSGGISLAQALRSLSILGWWVWWLVSFWRYFKHTVERFHALLAS